MLDVPNQKQLFLKIQFSQLKIFKRFRFLKHDFETDRNVIFPYGKLCMNSSSMKSTIIIFKS